MGGGGNVGAGVAGPVIGLANEIVDGVHVGRQLLRIAGDPGALLDDPRHRGAVERADARLVDDAADQPGVAAGVAVPPVHPAAEVGGDPEQLGELRVVEGEQIVDHRIAEEDDLQVQRDRLRLQRRRRGEAQGLGRRLDADAGRAQRPFERLVGVRVHEQLAGVDDQAAAVGPVQGARLDQGEVGHQRPELGHVLDPPDQVRLRRMVLVDHGRALGEALALAPLRLVHQHVDPVAAEGPAALLPPLRRRQHHLRPALLLGQEVVGILDDVVADGVEVGENGRKVGPARLQSVDQVADGVHGRLAVQVLDLLALFLLPVRDLAEERLQLLLQRLRTQRPPLLFLRRELLELLRPQHLAVLDRRQRQADRRADERHVALAGAGLQGVEPLLLALLELLLDHVLAVAVLLALERRRDRMAKLVDELLGVVVKGPRLPRRKPDRPRLVRLGEVVDVTPFRRRRPAGGDALRIAADEVVLAGAGRAEGEQVVAGVAHAHGEVHRLGRALLADGLLERLELGGGGEVEFARVAGRKQRTCR